MWVYGGSWAYDESRGQTVQMITERSWPANYDFEQYLKEKANLAQDWDAVQSMLAENTATVAATIRSVQDEDLGIEIQMPWGPFTLAQILSYPYWNMSYHEGQINYIASILGCLK